VAENSYVGVGLYTVPEVARMLGVSSQNLRRWAKGYRYAGKRAEPLFGLAYPELNKAGILTFMELIEFSFVVMFLKAGMSMRQLRAAARRGREQFQTNYPLATHRFHTDGRRLFAELGERIYEEYPSGQHVFDQAADFFKKLDYEGDLVRAYWPLGKEGRVVLNPARLFGQPSDAPSGVPTRVLFDMYAAGQSVEEVADWFELEPEGVHAAIEFERGLALAA